MAYIRYYDQRYGDLYEVYTDDVTGTFTSALRSVGGELGGEKIHYTLLSELPLHHRHQIEQILWQRQHPEKTE